MDVAKPVVKEIVEHDDYTGRFNAIDSVDAVMAALGFSLNNLTLFGLVLAIGIVVDDGVVSFIASATVSTTWASIR